MDLVTAINQFSGIISLLVLTTSSLGLYFTYKMYSRAHSLPELEVTAVRKHRWDSEHPNVILEFENIGKGTAEKVEIEIYQLMKGDPDKLKEEDALYINRRNLSFEEFSPDRMPKKFNYEVKDWENTRRIGVTISSRGRTGRGKMIVEDHEGDLEVWG